MQICELEFRIFFVKQLTIHTFKQILGFLSRKFNFFNLKLVWCYKHKSWALIFTTIQKANVLVIRQEKRYSNIILSLTWFRIIIIIW